MEKSAHANTNLPFLTEIQGLTQAEAWKRLQAEGKNELPSTRGRSITAIALGVIREPMFLLLLVAGVIYLLLGDVSDALMLLFFVCIVMGITIFQERKTERVLEALRDISSPRALVMREGTAQRIAGQDVVRGDILILNEGDRIPADAALISCHDFATNESMLTGESVPVRKTGQPGVGKMLPPGGEGSPFIYSGTLVVQGQGTALVLATGSRTELGKIGKSLHEMENDDTPLQKEINRLVRNLATGGILLSLTLVMIYGLIHDYWLQGLLVGITLAMTMLPEEYPLVLIVFTAMGAWRISRHRVLTRRIPTVEALGSITVLCTDKTGTLTLNQMTVQQLTAGNVSFSVTADKETLPELFHELLEFSILASKADPFDPMEKAIHKLGKTYLSSTEHLHRNWKLLHAYSLTPELLALSHVWQADDRTEYIVATKGAPEAIASLCHLDAQHLSEISAQVNLLARQGMRVLGVAKASYHGQEWPDIQHDFDFEFVGLIGLADPIRPTVPAAIEECTNAGIRIIMITGDYPATAAAIARQINLPDRHDQIITGTELDQMDEETLRKRIGDSNIFARMVPEQKLRLVNALKDNGEIVAMTGDGVNDAPALKTAHIGIAMGGRGTDVAREAASLVLLDDDFTSIVRAMRIGRGIFDNLRKAMAYIFAVHIPIAGLSLIPVLLGWPAVFAPVHIVFLEMIINPACSIAFEAEPAESDIMRRPPRIPQEPLFGKRIALLSLLQGTVLLLAALAVLGYALMHGATEGEARALTFSTLVTGNLGLILVNRSWQLDFFSSLRRPNSALWWVTGGALAFLLLALHVSFLREIFHLSPITPIQVGLCCAAGLCSAFWFELFKIFKHP